MGDYFFTELEIDAIGEISNICLGNSASTLSMLVRQTVDITPPRVEIIEKSEYTKNVSSKKVFVKVNYVEGVKGCSILILEEQDAKAIADLMMGSDGRGDFARMELGELHVSAVSEAMNQMMGAAATSMSVMLERKTDISTPEAKFMEDGEYLACEFPDDDRFVKVGFKLKIGDIIDSPVVQLYPHDLGKAISDLFLIKKAKEKGQQ
ncbi:MAG: flagellar motor switch phosphatase FliY [Lachnospiraceae bacterium]|jgi:flagellar motor switch protein FliN/FliY|nr:flagellar motor switch phosphatase FliY [Lachnospiraceae bacterium]